jgi:hypothetical protein
MRQALEVLAFVAGVVLITAIILSAVRSTVLPRATQARIPALAVRIVRGIAQIRAKRLATYEERDRVMAMVAPIALLLTLVFWMLIIVAAYTVILYAITRRSWGRSLELSGSSLVTLGTSSDPQLGASLVSYSEAGLGLLIVALFITYFPTIYNAFSRREAGVSLLEVRAGNPPQATTMLIRYAKIEERRYQLRELWRQWEAWFTDIEESHTTFPILALFRSPQPQRSWVTAAGALLDAASFWAGCIDHPLDPDVQLCLRAGYLALRRIADVFDLPYPETPSPDDPITITREEWNSAMKEMEEAGVALLRDREQAWRNWRGWRVNYDTVLLRLARLVEAPLAPWVSDRSPIPERVRGGRKASGLRRSRYRSLTRRQ